MARRDGAVGRAAGLRGGESVSAGDGMARRDFLRRVGRASAGTVCAGALLPLAGCVGVRYATATPVDGALRLDESEFAGSDAVMLENPRDPRPIFVHRAGDGSYTAVSTRCAHRGCQVQREGERLACPCHGSEYELDGDLLQGPADRALRRFRTRVRDGSVLIMLETAGAER